MLPQYGERLLKRLEEKVNCRGLNETLFRVSRSFYLEYSQIRELFDIEKRAMPLHKFMMPLERIVSRLSFSHIREIVIEKDPLGRFFYETECIKGCWSVKELRRQIAINLYFRSGISKNPQILLDNIDKQSGNALMDIRQPFTFEFLGLDAREAYLEKGLENSLLAHLIWKSFCWN